MLCGLRNVHTPFLMLFFLPKYLPPHVLPTRLTRFNRNPHASTATISGRWPIRNGVSTEIPCLAKSTLRLTGAVCPQETFSVQ